jgi:septal ring factor EnvC (AmiA/AmiB activator)
MTMGDIPTVGSGPITKVDKLIDGEPKHMMKFLKTAGAVMALVAAAGTISGVVMKAFYVTRSEYTMASTDEAVVKAGVQQTLNQLNDTLKEQKDSFQKLSVDINGVKTDIAVIKVRYELPTGHRRNP